MSRMYLGLEEGFGSYHIPYTIYHVPCNKGLRKAWVHYQAQVQACIRLWLRVRVRLRLGISVVFGHNEYKCSIWA